MKCMQWLQRKSRLYCAKLRRYLRKAVMRNLGHIYEHCTVPGCVQKCVNLYLMLTFHLNVVNLAGRSGRES